MKQIVTFAVGLLAGFALGAGAIERLHAQAGKKRRDRTGRRRSLPDHRLGARSRTRLAIAASGPNNLTVDTADEALKPAELSARRGVFYPRCRNTHYS